jgi:hypothetical protein
LPPEGLGLAADLHLGYQFGSGLAVELGYENFDREARAESPSFGGTGSTYSDTWDGSAAFLELEILYCLHSSRHWLHDIGLQAGMGPEQWRISYNSSYADSFNGMGSFLKPELRTEYLLGRQVGLSFGVGYRLGGSGDLSNSSHQTLRAIPASGAASPWHAQDSGFETRLGVNVYFSEL